MQPRPPAHEPPGATSPDISLGPSDPAPPETIPFTLEAITLASQGIIYRTERTTLIAKRVTTAQTTSPREPPEPDQAERSIAAKVFELLTALDPDNRLRKAPPIKVFNLYYRQRLEPAEIARVCKCHRSLIFDRLAAIQDKLSWTPQQLQDLSPQVEAIQRALSDSRAKDIHRKSAVYGDESDDGESD
jgi:hypothetical protein